MNSSSSAEVQVNVCSKAAEAATADETSMSVVLYATERAQPTRLDAQEAEINTRGVGNGMLRFV